MRMGGRFSQGDREGNAAWGHAAYRGAELLVGMMVLLLGWQAGAQVITSPTGRYIMSFGPGNSNQVITSQGANLPPTWGVGGGGGGGQATNIPNSVLALNGLTNGVGLIRLTFFTNTATLPSLITNGQTLTLVDYVVTNMASISYVQGTGAAVTNYVNTQYTSLFNSIFQDIQGSGVNISNTITVSISAATNSIPAAALGALVGSTTVAITPVGNTLVFTATAGGGSSFAFNNHQFVASATSTNISSGSWQTNNIFYGAPTNAGSSFGNAGAFINGGAFLQAGVMTITGTLEMSNGSANTLGIFDDGHIFQNESGTANQFNGGLWKDDGSGNLTAVSFSGSGANLSSLTAANLTGTGPAAGVEFTTNNLPSVVTNLNAGMVTLLGGLTSPGTGANSGVYGNGATTPGARSVSIGYDCTAGASSSGPNAIAIGAFANATPNGAVAVGEASFATGSQSVAIGPGTTASASGSIAIGSSASELVANAAQVGNPTSAMTMTLGNSGVVLVGTTSRNGGALTNLAVAGYVTPGFSQGLSSNATSVIIQRTPFNLEGAGTLWTTGDSFTQNGVLGTNWWNQFTNFAMYSGALSYSNSAVTGGALSVLDSTFTVTNDWATNISKYLPTSSYPRVLFCPIGVNDFKEAASGGITAMAYISTLSNFIAQVHGSNCFFVAFTVPSIAGVEDAPLFQNWRTTVNDWIRRQSAADVVVDYIHRFPNQYDGYTTEADGLHPTVLGSSYIAQEVDFALRIGLMSGPGAMGERAFSPQGWQPVGNQAQCWLYNTNSGTWACNGVLDTNGTLTVTNVDLWSADGKGTPTLSFWNSYYGGSAPATIHLNAGYFLALDAPGGAVCITNAGAIYTALGGSEVMDLHQTVATNFVTTYMNQNLNVEGVATHYGGAVNWQSSSFYGTAASLPAVDLYGGVTGFPLMEGFTYPGTAGAFDFTAAGGFDLSGSEIVTNNLTVKGLVTGNGGGLTNLTAANLVGNAPTNALTNGLTQLGLLPIPAGQNFAAANVNSPLVVLTVGTNAGAVTYSVTPTANDSASVLGTGTSLTGSLNSGLNNVMLSGQYDDLWFSTGSFEASGQRNVLIYGTNSLVLSGLKNALWYGTNSSIIGGSYNYLDLAGGVSGSDAIVAGQSNTITTSTQGDRGSVIVGGVNNQLTDSKYAVILGGQGNTNNGSGGNGSVIAGGSFNYLDAWNSGQIGGTLNLVSAWNSVILGGTSNGLGNLLVGESVVCGPTNSVILGGTSNYVGTNMSGGANNSVVGGMRAITTNSQSFVWSDGTTTFGTTADDQFNVYATGGIKLLGGTISGNGSGLTALNVSQLSGTVPAAQLPVATTLAEGIMEVGAGLAVNAGVVSFNVNTNNLPTAVTNQNVAAVTLGGALTVAGTGGITASNYNVPIAGTALAPNMQLSFATNYESIALAFTAAVNVKSALIQTLVIGATNNAGSGVIQASCPSYWKTNVATWLVTNWATFTITILPGMTNCEYLSIF